MSRRPAASVLSLLLSCIALPAQEKPRQDTFAERVEVRVRTIVAIVTDRDEEHLVSTPSPADLEVLEDGASAEIVGIEPLPRSRTPETAAQDSSAPAPSVSPASTKVAGPVAQVLYVEELKTGLFGSASIELAR